MGEVPLQLPAGARHTSADSGSSERRQVTSLLLETTVCEPVSKSQQVTSPSQSDDRLRSLRPARRGRVGGSGSEVGSYLRLIDSYITQLKAQGPHRTCDESEEA